jgi:hypothetical protein
LTRLAPLPASPARNDKTTAGDAKPAARHSPTYVSVKGNEPQRARATARPDEDLNAMPIRQYFVWVGSALLVALFAADWLLPGPAAHSHSAIPPSEKVNLRIRSDHKWPERVVFDTAHSGKPLATEPELHVGLSRDAAAQRGPLDSFAAMDRAQAPPTATNANASAIRAKPQPPGPRMTSATKTD